MRGSDQQDSKCAHGSQLPSGLRLSNFTSGRCGNELPVLVGTLRGYLVITVIYAEICAAVHENGN